MTPRSSQPNVRNPILSLPSAQRLLDQPADVRRAMARELRLLAQDLAKLAQTSWHSGQTARAVYCKAASVYAKHIAAAARSGRGAALCLVVPADAATSAQHARNPLLDLDGARRILQLPGAAREALAQVLLDLAGDATARAEKSWRTKKAPMAAYWRDVSIVAKRTAHTVRPRRGIAEFAHAA